MSETLARWNWAGWNRPKSLRDFAASAFCYLFPQLWIKRRLADTRWDEVEMAYLNLMVDSDRSAIDVGANSGKYAYYLAGLALKVYAFEPDPALAAKIARALPRNVEVHAAAVSSSKGTATLMTPSVSGHSSSALASIEPGVVVSKDAVSVDVPTIRLDDFVKEPVGFVKIDVEGHELNVLQGSIALISRDRPIVLIEAEERHRPGAIHSVRAFMEHQGFDGFFIEGQHVKSVSELTDQMQDFGKIGGSATRANMNYINNFIFAPNEKAADFKTALERALRNNRST